MSEELKCHICGGSAEFCCEDCEKPACEDCWVHGDGVTRIVEYTLCQFCDDGHQADRYNEACRAQAIVDEAKVKRDARNKASRERYWRPENVEKRRIAKEERKKKKAEQSRKSMEETFRIISNWTK